MKIVLSAANNQGRSFAEKDEWISDQLEWWNEHWRILSAWRREK
jgi:hypothetical protein